jgi:hypothetical protein
VANEAFGGPTTGWHLSIDSDGARRYCPLRRRAIAESPEAGNQQKGFVTMKLKKLVVVGVVIATLLYIGTYAVLSEMGLYAPEVARGATNNARKQLSKEVMVWYPEWTGNDYADPLAKETILRLRLRRFFSPLIAVDRKFVHKKYTVEPMQRGTGAKKK